MFAKRSSPFGWIFLLLIAGPLAAADAPRPPIVLSNLLVAMAPHVSRFVTRLFQVQPRADAVARLTRDQDDLFRFKVDFVRRRALPLPSSWPRV